MNRMMEGMLVGERWGWIVLIIKLQLSMKKHRKVGNRTDTNFFTTEFKLTSSEFPKERNPRKLNSSFNTFKHQLLRQEHKKSLRSQSKDAKPVIEQLNFLATGREDNFKAPHSFTKRSVSRGKEELKTKPELQNMQHFEESYMDIIANDAKKFSVGQIDNKKFKPISVKHYMKEKLEKSALEKFKATVLKENEENQNVVGEENTCALIQLMKTARLNNELGIARNSRELKPKGKASIKYKSMPSDQEEDSRQMRQGNVRERPESRRGSNADEEHKQYVMESKPEVKKPYMAVPKANQSLFKKFAQENSKAQALKTKQGTKQGIAKLLQPPKIKQSMSNFRSDVIQPQPIQNIKTNRSESREEFGQSEEESGYSEDLGLETKQSLPRKQSQQKSIQQLKHEDTLNKMKRKDSVSSSNAQKPADAKKPPNHPPPKFEETKKSVEKRADIPSDRAIALGRKDSQGSEKQSESMKPIPLSRPPSLREAQKEMLTDIPSATAISKADQPKPSSTKNFNPLAEKEKPAEYLQLQNNKVEKILTTNYFDQQEKYKNIQKKPTQPIKNPPVIQPKQQHLNKAKFQKNDDFDDEQMQQITIGKNGALQNVEKEKKPSQTEPKKPEPAAAKPTQPLQPVPPPPLADSQPITAQQNEPSEFQPGPLDELIYYIERIEDIGQYRMKSKDLFTDKSIDKQLLQTHKICAYYMAHQFLYLTKQAHEILNAPTFTREYYNISMEELETLRQEGELEGELENISANIEQSKKLLKKSYDEGKSYLRKEEQILLLDGRTNYHLKCCATLIKEFRLVHQLHQRTPNNPKLTERCCYLIELYCILKMFSGEEIKEYEDYEEIEDPVAHIANYRQLMAAQ